MPSFYLFLVIFTVSNAAQVPGGWESLPTIDASIVNFAFEQYQQNIDKVPGLTEGCGIQDLGEFNFTKQVVAGTNYRFIMYVLERCRHTTLPTKYLYCDVTVFDQPWTNTREVKWDAALCYPAREDSNAEVMTGGWESVSSIDSSIVNFAFDKYQQNRDRVTGLNEGCNIEFRAASNFTEQVVAGMNYRFLLEVKEICGSPQVFQDLDCFVQIYQALNNTREVKWDVAICKSVREGKLEGFLSSSPVEGMMPGMGMMNQGMGMGMPGQNMMGMEMPGMGMPGMGMGGMQGGVGMPGMGGMQGGMVGMQGGMPGIMGGQDSLALNVAQQFHKPTNFHQQPNAFQQQLVQQQLYAYQEQLAQQQLYAYQQQLAQQQLYAYQQQLAQQQQQFTRLLAQQQFV